MVHNRWLPACVFALAVTATAAGAQPAPISQNQNQCFYIDQFESWRAPDAKTIYIRVQLGKYYRLDLAGACPALQSPGSYLITQTRGPDSVCSAVDWELSVKEPEGIAEPCIVKTMTRLSPQDVAVIPRKFKP